MAPIDIPATLNGLARNFRWVWDAETQEVFRMADQQIWERTRDPFAVIRSLSAERFAELNRGRNFRKRLETARDSLDVYLADKIKNPTVAYFCMEHGIAPELRIYAGGLGMLAGCIEKTASDLGVPMVAVGLMYRQWFKQRLEFGWQNEDWQQVDPQACGVERCDVTVRVDLGGESVAVGVWKAKVGRVSLYLLDTDLPENPEHLRGITDRLYGGDKEHRIRQELILGVGGVRALAALGHDIRVFHANEGHAGFMCLERIRTLRAKGVSFDDAVRMVRAGTVFTTHTAVPAGFDLFERPLIDRYLGGWAAECGIGMERLMELGHFPGQWADEPFNMAALCAHLAEYINAVSKLHREITEAKVLGPLWPGRAAPVRNVTNGVHPKSWTPPEMAELYERYVGPGWEYAGRESWEGIWNIPDEALWGARQKMRARMVDSVRDYLPRTLLEQGWGEDLGWAEQVLDPNALTVVVARRAAEYKETDLLVSMPDWLASLTNDAERPLRVIISGLAHPKDEGGKERIRRIVEHSLRPEVRDKVVYLPGYSMKLAQWLLAGADVWLNHPRRGDEACGTSFMKAVYSGGRVMTTADGGADEMIVDGDNGWIIGDRNEGASREAMAHNAFNLIQHAVIPEFYDRNWEGLPKAWLDGVRRSIASLAPEVSAAGMVRAYHQMYKASLRASARVDQLVAV